jgi:hypothetical protein
VFSVPFASHEVKRDINSGNHPARKSYSVPERVI